MAVARVAAVLFVVALSVWSVSGARSRLRGQAPVDQKTLIEVVNAVTKAVKEASKNGQDAAQIFQTGYIEATKLVRSKFSSLNSQDRMDHIMAIMGFVFNGRTVRGVLPKADSSQTSTVKIYESICKDDKALAAGGNLDLTGGKGTLDPKLDDGTKNQVYHTNFFITAGYVAGKSKMRQTIVASGNVYHETLDAVVQGGGSRADYFASAMGQAVGAYIYHMRANKGSELYIPAAVYGMVSKPGLWPKKFSPMTTHQHRHAVNVAKDQDKLRDGVYAKNAIWRNPVNLLIGATKITSGFFKLFKFREIPPDHDALPTF